MKEPISIKEILAVVLKRGKAIVCTAIALAVLLGGVQGGKALLEARSPENTPEKIAERNEKAAAEYAKQKDLLEQYISNAQYVLDVQEEYNEKALVMQLDPYDLYKSTVLLSITDLDEDALLQIYRGNDSLEDFVTSKIQRQYVNYWKYLDVEANLKNNPFAGEKEKYVRELVDVTPEEGGLLNITTYANTEEESAALCKSVYDCLLEAQSAIAETSYGHTLVELSSGTKLEMSKDLAEAQYKYMETVADAKKDIATYSQTLSNLKKPSQETAYSLSGAVSAAVKWAAIGGVVGFMMACAVVWMLYIFSDGVETSRQAEAILEVPFFGSAGKKRDLFVRVANRFVGERQWKDREEAVQYIAENLKSRISGPEKIALVSTLNISAEDAGIQMVLQVMREQGHTVVFAGKTEENPAAIAALRESDYVLLAERLGTSSRGAMLHTMEQAKQLNAQVLGFITM